MLQVGAAMFEIWCNILSHFQYYQKKVYRRYVWVLNVYSVCDVSAFNLFLALAWVKWQTVWCRVGFVGQRNLKIKLFRNQSIEFSQKTDKLYRTQCSAKVHISPDLSKFHRTLNNLYLTFIRLLYLSSAYTIGFKWIFLFKEFNLSKSLWPNLVLLLCFLRLQVLHCVTTSDSTQCEN